MNFEIKRQSKKYAKLFMISAWVVAITYFAFIFVGIACVLLSKQPLQNSPEGHVAKDFFVMLLFISPLIISIILAFTGQCYADKRIKYMKMILEYRQRRFFHEIMEHIRLYEINIAIEKYDELLTNRDFRRFVYPIIITRLIDSPNEKQHQNGLKLLNNTLDKYSPDTINFNS